MVASVDDLLGHEILGNPAGRWAIALATGVTIVVALFLLKRIAIARLRKISEKTPTPYDDVLVEVAQDTRTSTILAAGLAGGVRTLDLPDAADLWIGRALFVVLAFQLGLWATHTVRLLFEMRRVARGEVAGGAHKTVGAAVVFVTRLLVWSIVLLSILSNLGVEVSTLIAGLGIGGLAAALAVQNVLTELVAAFSIYLDRPFDLGDFIVIDTFAGSVERIGWRTTHLRAISGEQIILANSDLAKARIRNHARMGERRVAFSVSVPYDTPSKKLEQVPAIIREEIARLDKVRFDRSHLVSFGESSIQFETVYFLLSTDYVDSVDRQQQLLLAIHRRFEEEGISFATPTRTVRVQSPSGAEIAAAGSA